MKQFKERLIELGKVDKKRYVIINEILEKHNLLYQTNLMDNIYSQEILKKLYKKLALVHHPDKGGDPETFIKVKEAYENNNFYALDQIDKGIKTSEPVVGNDLLIMLIKENDIYRWGEGIDRDKIESEYMNYEEAAEFQKDLLNIITDGINRNESPSKIKERLYYYEFSRTEIRNSKASFFAESS